MTDSSLSGLIAHWPFDGDCQERAGAGLTVANHGVLARSGAGPRPGMGAAAFDGRSAFLEVDDHPALAWGTGAFTVSVWLHTTDRDGDVVGDLLAKFDPGTRTGFHLGILTNGGVTSTAQANYRNLHRGRVLAGASEEVVRSRCIAGSNSDAGR